MKKPDFLPTIDDMKITDALVAEHRIFTTVFDFVEQALPSVSTLTEVQRLAGLIDQMLHSHAQAEEDLVFAALEHVLEEKGRKERFSHEHEEIDLGLKAAQNASDLAEAKRLLKKAITASRKHFKQEEKSVFPVAEKVMQAETLIKLGKAMLEKQATGHR